MSELASKEEESARIDRFATASFVAALGPLAWLLVYFLPPVAITLAILGAILAPIFGEVGKRRINRSAGRLRGRALARAGIALGVVELAIYVLGPLLLIYNFSRLGAP